jgi:hypothetical protein
MAALLEVGRERLDVGNDDEHLVVLLQAYAVF